MKLVEDFESTLVSDSLAFCLDESEGKCEGATRDTSRGRLNYINQSVQFRILTFPRFLVVTWRVS